jgi:hypothetical protein
MWILLILAVCIIVMVFWVLKNREKPPEETYVCQVCNERECICHKEEKG